MQYFIELDGLKYATDAQGYLLDASVWSEKLAFKIALIDEIELNAEQLAIVNLARDFYKEFNTTPSIRMLVKFVSQQFGKEKGNSIYLQTLFPKGVALQVSKIAGLPKPSKCL